ncbi:hypothetical protein Tco_0612540 [Tanacetum coccineum]
MAEENVPAPAPTRSDEHILPFKAWLPVGNCKRILSSTSQFTFSITQISSEHLLHHQIFQLSTYNSFRIPLHMMQRLEYIASNWMNNAGEQVMDFVNELGYPEEIYSVSKMHVNNLYQPWRAILTLINQFLMGKTSSSDKPKHSVLQMLWGIVTRSNVDYAELMWEVFVQAIQIFFTHQANLNVPTKKPMPHVIPYCRFTKLIIYYLGSRHNIYKRPVSPVHVTRDDFLLGNLKFVPKGEKDELFGKLIPQELITEAI